MAIADVTITPLGTGTSVGDYVSQAVAAMLGKPGIEALEVTPMGTILQGDLDAIWAAVRAGQEAVFAAGAQRVSTLIKIDDRRDKRATMQDKVARVKAGLPR